MRDAGDRWGLTVVPEGFKPPHAASGGTEVLAQYGAGRSPNNKAHSRLERVDGLWDRGSAGGLSGVSTAKVEATASGDEEGSKLDPRDSWNGAFCVSDPYVGKEAPHVSVEGRAASDGGPPHGYRSEMKGDALAFITPNEF